MALTSSTFEDLKLRNFSAQRCADYLKSIRPPRSFFAKFFSCTDYDYDPHQGIGDEFYYSLIQIYQHKQDKKENRKLKFPEALNGSRRLLSLFRDHMDQFAVCFFENTPQTQAMILASFPPSDRDKVAHAILGYKPRGEKFEVEFSKEELLQMLEGLKKDLQHLPDPYKGKLTREFSLVDRRIVTIDSSNLQKRLQGYVRFIQNIENRALEDSTKESSWRFFFSSPAKKAIGLCEHALQTHIPKGYLNFLKTSDHPRRVIKGV